MRNIIAICLMAVLLCGAAWAEQPASTDIWQLAPPNSLLVAGFDWRADNASIRTIKAAESLETRETMAEKQAAMRKAVESLATLFGISLDFAKDIESWTGQQWAVVVLPDGENRVQPVLMMASHDRMAADAALQKMLAPWQRIGELTTRQDPDFPITEFRAKNGKVQVYASATDSVVALSPSIMSLKEALQGGGFPAGSPGDKAFKALSGSMFYVFVDPAMLQRMNVKDVQIPVSGFGLGLSIVETGMRMRVLGFPNEQALAFLKPMLSSQQDGVLTVNPGIPSTTLVAASFPNLSGVSGLSAMFGMSKNPVLDIVQALGDTQISAAITAALPAPAGVATAMAESDQAAMEKLETIKARAKQLRLDVQPAALQSGLDATAITVAKDRTLYLAQIRQHVVLASDIQTLTGAAETISGYQPGISESKTYVETMSALGNSNLLTLYVNLAPVQGIGYLADAMGVAWFAPIYAALAEGLQNMQALGLGVGFDGEAVSATLFLRADPKMGPVIAPSVASFTAIGAAVLFPVFARAREAARVSTCANNLKMLGVGAMMYAMDWDGKLPTRTNWRTQLKDYVKLPMSEMKCPSGGAIYAFNKNLGGLNLDRIKNPADVVMFFEADPDLPNASGSRADAILPHDGKGWFAYADGHVVSLSKVPDQSHWVPKYDSPKPVKKPVPKKPRR